MRLLALILFGALITAELNPCAAQDRNFARANPSTSHVDFNKQDLGKGRETSPDKTNPIGDFPQRILDTWQPVRERLVQDDRLRTLTGIVGLGIAAYEAGPRSGIHFDFIGTEALRIGLQPQLNMLHERTGFTVEPSIGPRRFTVTFRKMLD